MSRSGYAVEFRSKAGLVCYASRRSQNGPVSSEVEPAYIQTWPTRQEAEAYMVRHGLDPSRPVPIGIGHMFPSVVPLDLADLTPRPWWLCGVLFSLDGQLKESLEHVPAPRPPTVEEARAEVQAAKESFVQKVVANYIKGLKPARRPKPAPRATPIRQAAFEFGD